MAKLGKTTGNLKMRTGPGMQFEPPIAYLVPDTQLEILGEEGEWWKVRAAGKEGYVSKNYVAVSESLGSELASLAKDASHREAGGPADNSAAGGREAGKRSHRGVDEK